MLQTYTPGYKVEFSQAEPMAESCRCPSLPKQPFPAGVMQNTTQPQCGYTWYYSKDVPVLNLRVYGTR